MAINEKSLENLKPFKKGNKGGGRIKGSVSLVTLLKKALEKKITVQDPFSKERVIDPLTGNTVPPKVDMKLADAIVVKWLAKCMEGDMTAIKEALERIDGKVPAKAELTGSDGGAIQIQGAIGDIEDRINQMSKQ